MTNDEYTTIDAHVGEGCYTEKRSKFMAFAHHVEDVITVKELIAEYRKRYYDARHVCYAYVLGADKATYRANDDGEPSSTAGKPILGQIQAADLTDIIVIVVRYYGGVNLGTGGLIVAYRTAASEAISNAHTVVRQVEQTIKVQFPYERMNDMMRIVKDMQARIVQQNFDNTCTLTLSIRESEAEQLRARIQKALQLSQNNN